MITPEGLTALHATNTTATATAVPAPAATSADAVQEQIPCAIDQKEFPVIQMTPLGAAIKSRKSKALRIANALKALMQADEDGCFALFRTDLGALFAAQLTAAEKKQFSKAAAKNGLAEFYSGPSCTQSPPADATTDDASGKGKKRRLSGDSPTVAAAASRLPPGSFLAFKSFPKHPLSVLG